MKEQLDLRLATNKRWIKRIKELPKHKDHNFGMWAGLNFKSMAELQSYWEYGKN